MTSFVRTLIPGKRFLTSFLTPLIVHVCFLLAGILLNLPAFSQNAIVTENALAGNPSSEWDISGMGDPGIQGFASDISVNKGQTVNFKINVTDGSNYTIKIYRLGYYNRNGARLIADLGSFTGTIQPAPITDIPTGLVDCGNWSVSASWNTTGVVSGVFIAKLTKTIGGGSSHIIFIVRDDAANTPILFKTSDATWQAYNIYGGNSFYTGSTGFTNGRAAKISYNRPFVTRAGGGGGDASEDWVFNAEYPMIRWMERNGYNVSYTTDVDMDRDATPITPSIHKILISVGHDEYWSSAERSKFVNARNAGVHLAFFSGNEVYWKSRWENSIDGNNTAHRTLVCYKEGTQGENSCGSNCDPLAGVWTGLWREGCSAGEDGCQPENALTGQISWGDGSAPITVPDTYKNFRFWRQTTIPSLGAGQTATLSNNTIGYEFDWEQTSYKSSYPNGRVPLSSTDINGKLHKLSLYRHSSGALVFGAGTVQWSWGLDSAHDRGLSVPDLRMQQATVNLFADMGVQPGSIQGGLVAVTASNDNLAPASVITSPVHNANISNSITYITISGTSADAGGGVVAGVEISVDNGVSWQFAIGTSNWTYNWLPASSGSYTIKVRAFDDLGNLETTGTAPSANAITVNVTVTSPVCPCKIFPASPTPANTLLNDNTSIEAGVKFKSTVNGYITAIRFFKPSTSGTYTVNLWDNATQQKLSFAAAQAAGTGWQTVLLPNPVAITAGSTYVASYYSSSGDYANTDNYFTSAVINGYLEALISSTGNENGIYRTGSSGFPTQFALATNYWVDIEFSTTLAPDTIAPRVTSVSPLANFEHISLNTTVRAVFSEPMDPASINTSSFELRNALNQVVSATVTYNASTRTATLTPSSPLSYYTTYTATVKDGSSYNAVRDIAGNHMAADFSWSFTTIPVPPLPVTEGPGGPILVVSTTTNPFSRYAVEILRAEGLNEFSARDISQINEDTLNRYDVVILGEMTLSPTNVTDLTNWVNAGGTLIAFKPDNQLATLLGITPAGGTLSNQYLLVNTASGPGAGIVGQTIQFHGTANQYNLSGATSLATLYSSVSTPTAYPAVTSRNVGSNGGKAVSFTYDLARSIVYTRQGNPAWEGQKRDGSLVPVRSDDLFFGNASGDPQPDWVNLDKVAIPQADEQQRLLANIILQGNLHRKPLPRFWYFPRKLKAVLIMTGDDHANGGTIGRFNHYLTFGNNTPADVLDWKAIRGSSYIYPSTPISDSLAAAFNAQGFEIALHLNTNCAGYNLSTLQGFLSTELPLFNGNFPSIPAPTTNRTHCIAWTDWASKPKAELQNGIRLNTDYYYWPGSWTLNRPGMFTGSGIPMRYADLDGTIIDNYQAATQLTDETSANYTNFTNALLDKAVGTEGYYGAFCLNIHTDFNGPDTLSWNNAIIASAQARQIPVISAKQMLTWLDGRNNSSFSAMAWNGSTLNFTISAYAGAHKLQAMVPVNVSNGTLNTITRNSGAITYTTEIIKGINYAFFDAIDGNYAASYTIDNTAPVITNINKTFNIDGTVTITWTTNELSDSRVDYGTSPTSLNLNTSNASQVTSHSITLSGLTPGATYYFRVTSADAFNNTTTEPIIGNSPLSFNNPNTACFLDQTFADFSAGITGTNTYVSNTQDGELTLNPTAAAEFTVLPATSEWNSFPWTGESFHRFRWNTNGKRGPL